GGDQVGLAVRLRADLGIHPLRQVQRERHLERDDDEDEDVRERDYQSRAEAHSSSAAAKRKPTPRTVWMKRGFCESSPSLRRRLETWTSSVLVEPNQLVSQTSSMRRSREITAPASLMRRARSSNSLRVRSTSSPPTLAALRAGSTRTGPISMAPSLVVGGAGA